MSYLNSKTLVGLVGSDPEQRQAKGNSSKFTVLSVATQRSWKNADDLVLLNANPLEDISHTRKIYTVVLGGKFYPLANIRAQSLTSW
jgi:hypothetical protein